MAWQPDVAAILAERARRLDRIRRSPPGMLEALRAYYAEHPIEFIDDWGMTYDPRLPAKGLPAYLPFSLFPRQREYLQWILDRSSALENGLCEKSRDAGASWCAVALACTLCNFRRGLAIGFGSRKEEYVDRIGDPKSLFYKGRMFMQQLPPEFRGDWNTKAHAPFMQLRFPHSESYIIGEAGDNIGRGNRTSIYFVDESAHLERPKLVDAALSATTDCRIDLSSVNGMGNPFAEKRFGGDVSVFTFSWRDDPRKDDAWYAEQCRKLDPVVVAQEIDIDYNASVEGQLIPPEWVNAAVGLREWLLQERGGERIGALDVADEGKDKNGFAARLGVELIGLEEWSGKGSDIYLTTARALLECDKADAGRLRYDADGLGAGVRGDAKRLNASRVIPVKVEPFRGSGEVLHPEKRVPGFGDRMNKDFFANFKAQSWWALRSRFKAAFDLRQGREGVTYDDAISIPPGLPLRARLAVELSQPTYGQNGAGRVLVNKAPGSASSPNLADAVMIAFAPMPGGFFKGL